jgi:predicted peroxiredoxin
MALTRMALWRLGAVLCLLLVAGQAHTHDGPGSPPDPAARNGLFVNLTTDDPFRAWMALHFALATHRMGHPVTLFLNTTAVRLASLKNPAPKFATAQDTPAAYLRLLVTEGASVLVCMPCLGAVGMTAAELPDGVLPGAPGLTQSAIFAEGARVISW